MSQRRVLFIGAILVAAGIGAPTTAIMAPRWSAKLPPAAPAAPAPAAPPEQPQPEFSEGGTPPVVPVDNHAPLSPDPIVTHVPPGTPEHFPAPADTFVESPPHWPAPPPTRRPDPLPAVGASEDYDLPSIAPTLTPGDLQRPVGTPQYEEPEPADR